MSSEGTTVSFERRGVQAEWEALQSGILERLWTHCGTGRLEHEDQGEEEGWGARASSEPHPGWPPGAIGSQHIPGGGEETDSEVQVSHLGREDTKSRSRCIRTRPTSFTQIFFQETRVDE